MKKGDVFLICIVICLAAAGFFFWSFRSRGDGGTLTVTVDGKVYGTYDLSEDQEVEIDGEWGCNRFSIKDGTVRMIEADCPDQYCVNHAPVDKENETIICLPHKLVLKITDGEENNEIDA